jgi:hypothetical protein
MAAALALSSVERPYDQGRQCFEHIVDFLDGRQGSSMTISQLERELEKRSRQLMRILLQEHLDSRGPGQCQATHRRGLQTCGDLRHLSAQQVALSFLP